MRWIRYLYEFDKFQGNKNFFLKIPLNVKGRIMCEDWGLQCQGVESIYVVDIAAHCNVRALC